MIGTIFGITKTTIVVQTRKPWTANCAIGIAAPLCMAVAVAYNINGTVSLARCGIAELTRVAHPRWCTLFTKGIFFSIPRQSTTKMSITRTNSRFTDLTVIVARYVGTEFTVQSFKISTFTNGTIVATPIA